MWKTILSPFFLAIIVLWPSLLVLAYRTKAAARSFAVAALVALFALTALSTGLVSGCLERSIEAGFHTEDRCPEDAVVVLSGGYIPGENAGTARLSGESALRVIAGAELLKRCGTRKMVLSGSSKVGPRGVDGELMRELALKLGVPADRILVEAKSSTTREHVSELEGTGWFGTDTELAIVTSPWHLRRAMMVFSRTFPRAYPVMAYGRPSFRWELFPKSGALEKSTIILHEYIGSIWYALLDRLSGKDR
jgi:uncharacterized SAM-binding protein YcdF (DUF218 family)